MKRLDDAIGTRRLYGRANGQGQTGTDARACFSAPETTRPGNLELVRVG